tara:strand:+ start:1966 stop:2829 length:864 start_codon:yes stop_codon:yes gene_type:complete
MSSDKVHCVVIVDSNNRHVSQSRSLSDFIFRMATPVNFHKRSQSKQYFARIENVNLPISFYAINSNYNTFVITETNGVTPVELEITLTEGNYTIDELIAELQTQLNAGTAYVNTYVLTYDEITQKVSITFTTGGGGTATTIDATGTTVSNTLGAILGFTENFASSFLATASLTGSDVAYTNTTRYLKLYIDNINSNNVYDHQHVRKVGLKLPINEVRNEFQFYKNSDGYKIQLPSIPTINEMRIKLTDPEDNVVDLHGVPWSFDVVFYEYNKSDGLSTNKSSRGKLN